MTASGGTSLKQLSLFVLVGFKSLIIGEHETDPQSTDVSHREGNNRKNILFSQILSFKPLSVN